jgi:hypothetical protein
MPELTEAPNSFNVQCAYCRQPTNNSKRNEAGYDLCQECYDDEKEGLKDVD